VKICIFAPNEIKMRRIPIAFLRQRGFYFGLRVNTESHERGDFEQKFSLKPRRRISIHQEEANEKLCKNREVWAKGFDAEIFVWANVAVLCTAERPNENSKQKIQINLS